MTHVAVHWSVKSCQSKTSGTVQDKRRNELMFADEKSVIKSSFKAGRHYFPVFPVLGAAQSRESIASLLQPTSSQF